MHFEQSDENKTGKIRKKVGSLRSTCHHVKTHDWSPGFKLRKFLRTWEYYNSASLEKKITPLRVYIYIYIPMWHRSKPLYILLVDASKVKDTRKKHTPTYSYENPRHTFLFDRYRLYRYLVRTRRYIATGTAAAAAAAAAVCCGST